MCIQQCLMSRIIQSHHPEYSTEFGGTEDGAAAVGCCGGEGDGSVEGVDEVGAGTVDDSEVRPGSGDCG